MEEGGERRTYCVDWSCDCGVGGLGASGQRWVWGLDGLLLVRGGVPLSVVRVQSHVYAHLFDEIKNKSGS